MRRPVLVKGDGPVTRLRGWFKQFYSSGEPKLALAPAARTAAPDACGAEGDAAGDAAAPPTPVIASCPAKGAADW
jgi:hypothetical protein